MAGFHVETLVEAMDDYGLHLAVVIEVPSGHTYELESVVSENTPDGPRVTLVCGARIQ